MTTEEKQLVDYILHLIPKEDQVANPTTGQVAITPDAILLVLDTVDDYLLDKGLAEWDETTEELTYLEGDVDETEQLQYVLQAVREEGEPLSFTQEQLILDAEKQYGIEQGYYEDLD